jgi:DNA invertase Pin-like site-specific DNA recombinase
MPLAAAGEPTPAAAYIRMSAGDQYSMAQQLVRLREFAAKHGLEIVQVYAEAGNNGDPR